MSYGGIRAHTRIQELTRNCRMRRGCAGNDGGRKGKARKLTGMTYNSIGASGAPRKTSLVPPPTKRPRGIISNKADSVNRNFYWCGSNNDQLRGESVTIPEILFRFQNIRPNLVLSIQGVTEVTNFSARPKTAGPAPRKKSLGSRMKSWIEKAGTRIIDEPQYVSIRSASAV